jgi:hypothetical protein
MHAGCLKTEVSDGALWAPFFLSVLFIHAWDTQLLSTYEGGTMLIV